MENRKEWLRMEIESLSKSKGFARVVVAVFISRIDPTLEKLSDVKMVASEAVTNAVVHDYQGKDDIIYVEASVEGDELTIIVGDKSVGVRDMRQAMEPMFTSNTTGERSGMGFSFIEAFMDEVRMEPAPDGGTTVTMKKRIGEWVPWMKL